MSVPPVATLESAEDILDFLPHLLTNTPCKVSSASLRWKINLDMMLEQNVVVPVDGVGETRQEMLFSTFMELASQTQGIYAKDWHIDQVQCMQNLYETPKIFRDDWLNWYWQCVRTLYSSGRSDDSGSKDKDSPNGKIDDYSFCYVGTPGSHTRTHHDVCLSYSWSVNVSGTKRWYLWPPKKALTLFKNHIHDKKSSSNTSGLIYNDSIGRFLHSLNSEYILSDPRPNLMNYIDINNSDLHNSVVIIEQKEGEAVFVPSGWYHFVENTTSPCTKTDLGLTISINRNWINSFNIYNVTAYVLREWVAVQQELVHLLEASEREYTYQSIISCGSSYLNIVYSEDEVCMNAIEWHKHCDILLRSTCALSASMLLELLSSRLELFCRLCKASSTYNTTSWLSLFCNINFYDNYVVSAEDKELFETYQSQTIEAASISSNNETRNNGEDNIKTISLWMWQCNKLGHTLEMVRDTPGFCRFMDVNKGENSFEIDTLECKTYIALTDMIILSYEIGKCCPVSMSNK
jgi:hypothetical protein